jgi:hypothetical protein
MKTVPARKDKENNMGKPTKETAQVRPRAVKPLGVTGGLW